MDNFDIKNGVKRLLLRFLAPIYAVYIQEIISGHVLSCLLQRSVDKSGNPIPWFSYPAIEFLKQINLSKKTVFEYGCGNSTIYWSKMAQKVISIEADSKWYEKITKKRMPNTNIFLIKNKRDYVNSIKKIGRKFDVIIIDGHYRTQCAKIAPTMLRKGGMIILDNSEWFRRAAKILKNFNFIQIDMIGLSPANFYNTSTSFFLDRRFNLPSKYKDRPGEIIGSLDQETI